jgi:hypothetical protein
MNKRQNTNATAFTAGRDHKSFFGFLMRFTVNGGSFFEVFTYANTYQEKLPIIYANIRV